MAIVRGRESLGSRLFDVANVIFLLLLSITFIYPFWTTFLQAFAPANEVYRSGLHIWIDRWRLDSWAFVFGHEPVGLVYANTLFRVFFGTLLTLVVTFSGAYALSKRNLPFRTPITTAYLLTLFFSGGLIPTYLLIRGLGLYNTRLVLILPVAIHVFYIIIARNFLMTIDQAMEDSAVIDGAGYWRVLFTIIVPLAKPVIAVIALWTAVSHWNSWFDAMIYAPKRELRVLQMLVRDVLFRARLFDQLTEFVGELALDLEEQGLAQIPPESVKAATIMITIGPIILFYPFIQKYFVKGVMLGSLKG